MLLLLFVLLVVVVVVLLTTQLLVSNTDGGIDVELTSLTFFCAITFRDTAVSAEFIVGVWPGCDAGVDGVGTPEGSAGVVVALPDRLP